MENDPNKSISARLDWAVHIAREAGDRTLDFFHHSDLAVETKADSSPVTAADRAAEKLLRERIAERFADDSILGEEFGATEGSSGFRWVLDPIDGTKSFVHGVPLYTTLVAVLEGDTPQIGVIYAPACGEMVYAAKGGGCWYLGGKSADALPTAAWVSQVKTLDKSLMLTSEIISFATGRSKDALPAYLELQRVARLARTWGDGYGYLMVATGRAEVMLDAVMNLWDAACLQPIIEEAGGRFTDWKGKPTVHSGEAVATNTLVADEVLAILRGY